jgi:hypothetical protein
MWAQSDGFDSGFMPTCRDKEPAYREEQQADTFRGQRLAETNHSTKVCAGESSRKRNIRL